MPNSNEIQLLSICSRRGCPNPAVFGTATQGLKISPWDGEKYYKQQPAVLTRVPSRSVPRVSSFSSHATGKAHPLGRRVVRNDVSQRRFRRHETVRADHGPEIFPHRVVLTATSRRPTHGKKPLRWEGVWSKFGLLQSYSYVQGTVKMVADREVCRRT